MDPLLRERLKEHFANVAYDFLISLIRAKETSKDFYGMRLKKQKATEKDLNEISQEQSVIFLDGLESYMNEKHILNFEDIPNPIRKEIAKNAMDQSLNNWETKNKGRTDK